MCPAPMKRLLYTLATLGCLDCAILAVLIALRDESPARRDVDDAPENAGPRTAARDDQGPVARSPDDDRKAIDAVPTKDVERKGGASLNFELLARDTKPQA